MTPTPPSALERWRERARKSGYVGAHMADTVTPAARSPEEAIKAIENEIAREQDVRTWSCSGNCRTCEKSREVLAWLREEQEKDHG